MVNNGSFVLHCGQHALVDGVELLDVLGHLCRLALHLVDCIELRTGIAQLQFVHGIEPLDVLCQRLLQLRQCLIEFGHLPHILVGGRSRFGEVWRCEGVRV